MARVRSYLRLDLKPRRVHGGVSGIGAEIGGYDLYKFGELIELSAMSQERGGDFAISGARNARRSARNGFYPVSAEYTAVVDEISRDGVSVLPHSQRWIYSLPCCAICFSYKILIPNQTREIARPADNYNVQ